MGIQRVVRAALLGKPVHKVCCGEAHTLALTLHAMELYGFIVSCILVFGNVSSGRMDCFCEEAAWHVAFCSQ